MASPVVFTIRCYIYRNTGTKLWTAVSSDLSECEATCTQPEDVLRRIQSIALEQLSRKVMYGVISDNIQININTTVVTEEEALRLTSGRAPPSADDLDP